MVNSSTVTVSSKYQVVIPAEIRRDCNIKPGDRFRFSAVNGSIKLVRVKSLKEMYGIAPGIDTTVERDEEERV